MTGGACRDTINQVFGVHLGGEAEVGEFLARRAEANPAPANAAEYLNANIGIRLTDLFFRPYTRKMWGLELEELDVSVVRRIPIRTDNDDRYFPADRFQMLPRDGYARVFENILDHERINVVLSQAFEPALARGYAHCFNSMAIDEFFDYRFGPLPYRSIRFHHRVVDAVGGLGEAAVVNFTDAGPMTRQTDWSRLPAHVVRPGPRKTVTTEEPCDYAANGYERYYPVKTSDGRHQAIYQRYRELARALPAMTFIGRCGTYQYLDMHQVINQSLAQVSAWIEARAASG